MKLTGAILAGGLSSRLGRDKALLSIGATTLLERTYRVLSEIMDEIIIITGRHTTVNRIDAPIVPDALPIRGPLTGIVSALLYSQNPYAFVVGCDMPFITAKAIRYLIDQIGGEDIIVPKVEKGYEPLHAIYNRACISTMLSSLERGNVKVYKLFSLLTTKFVEGGDIFLNNGISVFTNINTQEDLSRAYDYLDGLNK